MGGACFGGQSACNVMIMDGPFIQCTHPRIPFLKLVMTLSNAV